MALFLFPQNLVVPLFTPEPCGPLFTSEPHGLPPILLRSRVVYSLLPQNPVVLPLLWLPRLDLNPSAHLPL